MIAMAVNWSFLPQMTAAIGVLIAAGSLAWGLWSYRMTKRHDYIIRLRQTVSDCIATCERIRLLLPYDLAHEITSSVVYSKEMAFVFRELYTKFFQSKDGEETSKAELERYLREEFEPVGVSIHTPLTDAFVDLTYSTTSEIEHYQSDYPALYRVLYAVNYIFIQITRHYRGKVRDIEEWRRAVRSVFGQHRARINSPEELQSYVVVYFVSALEADRKRYFQAEIDDHLEILNLVAKAYMAKPERQLLRQGKQERKEDYAPVQYVTTEQDLKEAEKGIQHALDHSDPLMLEYNNKVDHITMRRQNSKAQGIYTTT
jgi:hypothetical protein